MIEIPVLPCVSCSKPSVGRVAETKDGGYAPVYRMKCQACTEAATAFLPKPERLPQLPPPIGQRRYDGPPPRQAMPAGRPVHVDAVKFCRGCSRSLSIGQFAQKVQNGRNRGRRRYCIECNRREEMENS